MSSVSATTMSANAATGLYMPQTYSFLSPETFETLVEGYINQLHIRKRNKALISQQLANDCLMVLTNPENTAIFNPKFRWWVRKHFVFTVVGELRILMDKKNGKPVCVREQLYDKVCYFHHIIGHGGRDKTFAAITKSYSKVPAELVSLFTKNCQTCLGVRKYSKNKRPILNEFEYPGHHSPQPQSQPQPQHHQQQPLSQPQHHGHPHAHHLQLTCNTSGFSPSLMRSEHGTISPISPIMGQTASSFFGNSQIQYSQVQHHQLQQQQAALASHLNMSMSLSDITLSHLSNTNNFQSPTSDSSSPSILTKLEIPFNHLMHQQINTGLHSPTDLPDHHFGSHQQSSPTCSTVDPYSPTLQEFQHHHDYSQTFSNYSAAAAALSLSAFSHPQQQHHDSSPILSQAQLFHKQFQQEHQRFQQQHRFLPDALITSNLASTPSAVPTMICSIPTPTSGSPLSEMIDDPDEMDVSAHSRAVQEELEKCHLTAVAELVSAQL